MRYHLHTPLDQQAYTVTVYADSNINIQTYADQSGYKTHQTIQHVKKS